jgi:hypothetical protein
MDGNNTVDMMTRHSCRPALGGRQAPMMGALQGLHVIQRLHVKPGGVSCTLTHNKLKLGVVSPKCMHKKQVYGELSHKNKTGEGTGDGHAGVFNQPSFENRVSVLEPDPMTRA